jgi:hypothetical protein
MCRICQVTSLEWNVNEKGQWRANTSVASASSFWKFDFLFSLDWVDPDAYLVLGMTESRQHLFATWFISLGRNMPWSNCMSVVSKLTGI